MEAMKVISKTKNYLVAEDCEGNWIAFTAVGYDVFREIFFNEIASSKIQDVIAGRCGSTVDTLSNYLYSIEAKVSNTSIVCVTPETLAAFQ